MLLQALQHGWIGRPGRASLLKNRPHRPRFQAEQRCHENRFSKLEHSTGENVFRASEEFIGRKITLSGQSCPFPDCGEVIALFKRISACHIYIVMRYK
uniref:Uncharacterized protein n=1 Tax=Acidobacterium capsulatum TaxID=33075 RepID=A0A7V4XUU9_9BACT